MHHWFLGGTAEVPSVANLDSNLRINNISVLPVLRHKGGDASASGFPSWGYGQTINYQNIGTAPDFNQSSAAILKGYNDKSVKFNVGNFYQATDSTYANVTTEDFVVELVLLAHSAAFTGWLAKRTNGNLGFNLIGTTNNAMRLQITDASAHNAVRESAANSILLDTWYHVILFVRRASNAQWFINGVASGAALDVSAIGTLGGLGSIVIGALRDGGTTLLNGSLAYVAMWVQANWLDTEQQSSIALSRFNSLRLGQTLV